MTLVTVNPRSSHGVVYWPTNTNLALSGGNSGGNVLTRYPEKSKNPK